MDPTALVVIAARLLEGGAALDPTLILVIAVGIASAGIGVGQVVGRPARPQPTALAALQEAISVLQTTLATMQNEVTVARAEAVRARAEAGAAAGALDRATQAWATERRALWSEMDTVRNAQIAATTYGDQLLRAVGQEPDGGASILARMPRPALGGRKATSPLPWRALFPVPAQAALLGLLLTRPDAFGTRDGRTLLLSGGPDEWVAGLARSDAAREDLTAILESAARYDLALLSAVLNNAGEVIGAGSQTGALLVAWRAEWQL